MGTPPCFTASFYKQGKRLRILSASLDDKNPFKKGLYFFSRELAPMEEGAKNDNGRVVSLERVPHSP